MAKNLKCNFPLRWGLIVLITICLLSHFHVSAIGGLPSHKPSNGTLIYLDPDTKNYVLLLLDDEAYWANDQENIPDYIDYNGNKYPVVGFYQQITDARESICAPLYINMNTIDDDEGKPIMLSVSKNLTKCRIDYYNGFHAENKLRDVKTFTLLDWIRKMSTYTLPVVVEEGNPEYSSFGGVWYDADRAKLLYIPDKVTEVVTAPECTEVCHAATASSSKLQKITFGESVMRIGSQAFKGNNLDTIISLPVNPIPATDTSFGNYSPRLIVPDESLQLYRTTYPWRNFYNISTTNESGIKNTEISVNNQDVEIYTLSGLRITDKSNLSPGIYILRSGSKVKKTVIINSELP